MKGNLKKMIRTYSIKTLQCRQYSLLRDLITWLITFEANEYIINILHNKINIRAQQ